MTSAKFWGLLTPPPPRPHFTQPISTIRPQNLAFLEPPLPPLSADVICTWSLFERQPPVTCNLGSRLIGAE